MADVTLLDWDDEIENDGNDSEFVVLESGDYKFSVAKFERGHYTPSASAKTPACNMAIVTLKISTSGGDCFIRENFPMASTMEWKISAFFRSIGMKQHGEKLKMDWQGAVGREGLARITKDPGEKNGVFFNHVKNFIDPPAEGSGDITW